MKTSPKTALPVVGALLVLIPSLSLDASTDSTTVQLFPAGTHTASLAPGESHTYTAALRSGDFLRLVVEQGEIDVMVTVEDPTGRRLGEFDHPYGREIGESVALIASTTGTYRLEVRPYASAARGGTYRLRVEAWRPATPVDRLRVAAEQATYTAHRTAGERTADALRVAVEEYRAARDLW